MSESLRSWRQMLVEYCIESPEYKLFLHVHLSPTSWAGTCWFGSPKLGFAIAWG
jgi:hypothetical protein